MSDPREPVGTGSPAPNEDPDPDFLDDPVDPFVDDELDPDEAPPEELDDPAEPPPETERQTRRQRQSENWRARAEQAEREAAELRGRQSVLDQPRPPAVDPQAAQREEAEFRQSLDNMLPGEAALAVAERQERRFQAQLMQARVEGFDRSDSATFSQFRAGNPAADRLAPQVEKMLAANRAAGDYRFGRMDIYDLLRGREMRERGPRAAAPQRRQGAARVAAATTRPASGRGDVARGGASRTQGDADERLLRGTTVGDIV